MAAQKWNNWPGDASDPEIQAIDNLKDQISPIAPNLVRIRHLIGNLEMCHHKAERWVSNIIDAIAAGETSKGLGTRASGRVHPTELVSKRACAALSDWVAGSSPASIDGMIGSLPASRLLSSLGERTALKEWQVQRVIEKIRNWSDWPRSDMDPSTQYVWLSYEQKSCPDRYKEHEDFWRQTVETVPFGGLKGLDDKPFSLGFAIDLLWTCHWKFLENLQIVLEVIGGNYTGEKPFAACCWNITLSPIRPRMQIVCNTLRVFCGNPEPNKEIDHDVLALLGNLTNEKKWLAASLDETIRLQLSL